MIQIGLRPGQNNDSHQTKYALFVDDECVPMEEVEVFGVPFLMNDKDYQTDKVEFRVNVLSSKWGSTFAASNWDEIPLYIEVIDIKDYFPWSLFNNNLIISRDDNGDNPVRVTAAFHSKQGQGYSVTDILDYYQEFSMFINSEEGYLHYNLNFAPEHYGFSFSQRSLKMLHGVSLTESLDPFARLLSQLHLRGVEKLESAKANDSIVAHFKFPDSVKIPCEQYLLYFAQFLKDAGVDATANLSHEAGEVLFSVTPSNENEALDKIHHALTVYLGLPSNPSIILSPDFRASIEVQRLAANVQHLQGQIMLANAALQLKDATIAQQQIAIDNHRGNVITNDVLVTALKEVVAPSDKKDREALLGGVVELKPYEGKGFNVNLPLIYRGLKLPELLTRMRAFFKNEEKPQGTKELVQFEQNSEQEEH